MTPTIALTVFYFAVVAVIHLVSLVTESYPETRLLHLVMAAVTLALLVANAGLAVHL